MLKHVVEAFSHESYEDAIYKAMDKASAFLTGHQSDAHVAIKALDHSENLGYHAVLEITLVPMSLRDNMHIRGIFRETRLAHDFAFRLMLKEEHEHLHHVLDDHFARARTALEEHYIPDFILVPLRDVDIVENDELEKSLHPHPTPPT